MQIAEEHIRHIRTLTEFTLTEEHRKLLRRMYIGWQWSETGAPEVDPKRPYGNSSVALDVAEILKWPIPNEESKDFEREYAALERRAASIHAETLLALEVLVQTGQDAPGLYVRESRWRRPWVRREPAPAKAP